MRDKGGKGGKDESWWEQDVKRLTIVDTCHMANLPPLSLKTKPKTKSWPSSGGKVEEGKGRREEGGEIVKVPAGTTSVATATALKYLYPSV